MKFNKDSFDKSMPLDPKTKLPVKAPNLKLQEDPKKTFLVNCISSMPLAFEMSKQEVRINYLHGVIQGKIPVSRQTQSLGLPKMQMAPESQMGMAPSQVNQSILNPFMKSPMQPSPQIPMGPMIPRTQVSNIFMRQNNNFPVNKNPFVSNQFKTNQPQLQRNMLGNFTDTQAGPGLVKQTSFGTFIDNKTPFSTQAASPFTSTQPQNQQPFTQQPITGILGMQAPPLGQTVTNIPAGQMGAPTIAQGPQVPGLMSQTPSFGNLSQSLQPQPQATVFGQQPVQQTSASIFGAPTTFPLQSTVQALNFGQPPVGQLQDSKLDENIKQILQSKPNLWNILALDPNYKNGFNECGRMYVKSVLQRIIDENILSQESLNKLIIEIYKQMYGPESFQKVLENRKNELSQFSKLRQNKMDLILSQQFDKRNAESVFPQDLSSIGDDFYRSSKRKSPKVLEATTNEDDDKYRFERKYLQVKRPTKSLQLKLKFIEVKKYDEATQKSVQAQLSQQNRQKITENLNQIRTQHRKRIMPTEQDLPITQGFDIIPSIQSLQTYTKYELLSVPKVTISNEWGSVRFKTPISLLRKNLNECIVINQKSVEIIDEEWKVRDAEITFNKFADFSSLQQDEQNQLQEKIMNWCQKEEYELLKIDKQRGKVVIQI